MLTRSIAGSGGIIPSQVVPLTIQALEIVLADLKGGNSQNEFVTLPSAEKWKPFITITHETGVKIMKLYTNSDLELSKTE